MSSLTLKPDIECIDLSLDSPHHDYQTENSISTISQDKQTLSTITHQSLATTNVGLKLAKLPIRNDIMLPNILTPQTSLNLTETNKSLDVNLILFKF